MSGSSSDPNVNVTITATDAGFVATTKAAQAAVAAWAQITGQASQTAAQASVNYQQLINSTTGVTGAHREAAASAEVFRKALGDATNEVKQLRSNMEGTSGSIVDGTKRAAAGTSNITRELVVLGHEAMTGRFSRIPGSLVVLSEYLGQASLAVTGLIAGFAMAAIAAERLVVWMGKINDLKTGVQAAGAFFNPDVDQSKLTDIAMKFRQLKDVTTEDSQQVVAAYARMKGATIETIQALLMKPSDMPRRQVRNCPPLQSTSRPRSRPPSPGSPTSRSTSSRRSRSPISRSPARRTSSAKSSSPPTTRRSARKSPSRFISPTS